MKKIRLGWSFLGVLMAMMMVVCLNAENREAARREYAERVMQEEEWMLQALSQMRQGMEPDEEELMQRLPGTKRVSEFEDGLFLVTHIGFMNHRGVWFSDQPIDEAKRAYRKASNVHLTEWAQGEKWLLYLLDYGWD